MHSSLETNTLDKNLQQPPMTTLGGRRLLFVMADRAEYGPHLQQRFIPLLTGIGPVEAAVQLTTALTMLAARGERPDLVVSLGSAGSRVLEQTGIFQAISVAYRDMDVSSGASRRFSACRRCCPCPCAFPALRRQIGRAHV